MSFLSVLGTVLAWLSFGFVSLAFLNGTTNKVVQWLADGKWPTRREFWFLDPDLPKDVAIREAQWGLRENLLSQIGTVLLFGPLGGVFMFLAMCQDFGFVQAVKLSGFKLP